MTDAEALAAIQGYASANRIEITPHAELRMARRGHRYEDVRRSLMTATGCSAQANGRWKTGGGVDIDGDELTCVVVLVGRVVVVTLF